MKWRQFLDYTAIWHGTERYVLKLERIGPLFKVCGGEDKNPTWHLTYNGAKKNYLIRVIEEKSRLD